MINKTYLFEKLLSYCDNLQGVEEQVLDAHLQKHGLILRADHHSFLLKYGNSVNGNLNLTPLGMNSAI